MSRNYFVAHLRNRWAVYRKNANGSASLVSICFSREKADEEANLLNNKN